MISKILIILLIVCTVNAATWMSYLPEKPKEFAHKEGCYVKEINNVVPFGTEVKPIGYCYRIYCGGGMLDYASCGIIRTANKNCYKTKEDLTKPYPDCCPYFKCDSENDIDVVS